MRPAEPAPRIRSLPLRWALLPVGPRGRIGLIALATDFNSEAELRRMAPDGVELFTNRVANLNPVTIPNLRAMAPDITRAAAGILPGHALDVMIYGCTTGTAAIGEASLDDLIRAARPNLPVTNPIRATTAACAALRARRVSVLTPYTRAVNEVLLADLQGRGLDVLSIAGFDLDDDAAMTGVPAEALFEAAAEALAPAADLLFVSCTALRVATILDDLELRLGRPVVASNQALLWHALRLIGYGDPGPRFGRLFSLPLPP
jgi:maleate isomerase